MTIRGRGRPTVLQKRSPSTESQVQGSVPAAPAQESLGVREAAAFLGVHERTVRSVLGGKMASTTVGGMR